MPLLVIAGISGLVISNPGKLADPGTQANALAHVGIAAIFTLAFGILAVAGEYRHKTITDSYLTTPGPRPGRRRQAHRLPGLRRAGRPGRQRRRPRRRGGLVVGQGRTVRLGQLHDVGPRSAAASPPNAAFAAIGVGLGALIRNLVGAIAIALAWIAVVEGIVGQLVGNLPAGCRSAPARHLGGGDGQDCWPRTCCPAWVAQRSSPSTPRCSPRRPSPPRSAATSPGTGAGTCGFLDLHHRHGAVPEAEGLDDRGDAGVGRAGHHDLHRIDGLDELDGRVQVCWHFLRYGVRVVGGQPPAGALGDRFLAGRGEVPVRPPAAARRSPGGRRSWTSRACRTAGRARG